MRSQVKANAYLGVDAYTLDELFIISNQYSREFLQTVDSQIAEQLSDEWPNSIPIGELESSGWW